MIHLTYPNVALEYHTSIILQVASGNKSKLGNNRITVLITIRITGRISAKTASVLRLEIER